MPFVPNATAVEVAIKQRYAGRNLNNVLHFDFGSIPTDVELAAFAELVANVWGTEVVPNTSNQLEHIGVRARSLTSEIAAQVEYDYPAPLTGTATTYPLKANSALVLTLRTGRPGRSYRGRVYLAAVIPAVGINNNANSEWAELMRSSFAAFIGGVETVGGPNFCVYSRKANGDWRTTGVLTPVTLVALRDYKVDSQRRRTGR
jgi:hypothetical protein